MSEQNEPVDTSCCASCGTAEIDDIKLVPCDGCDLVKYCSDDCLNNHKLQHEEDCKKRAAELREELLFKQPEGSHMGDCPICSLPMQLDPRRYVTYQCCSKIVCKGCVIANDMREAEAPLCPFCRSDVRKFKSMKHLHKLRMKRVKANDPVAMCEEGAEKYREGDYRSAFEYWTKAVELGNVEAHYNLSILYDEGHGVEKDEKKKIHHLEEASIGGHPHARVCLGDHENSHYNEERAVKHWIIAATHGYDVAIKMLMDGFKEGFVEKEVLAAALRAHKAAVDETKSPQRQLEEKLIL